MLLLGVGAGASVAATPGNRAHPAARRADLKVSAVAVSTARLTPGGAVSASVKTVNAGKRRAKASSTALYASNDGRKSSGDIRLGSVKIRALKPHKSKRATIHGTVPSGTPAAGYRLLACADATRKVRERNERNNCRAASAPVTVLGGGTGDGATGGGAPPAGPTPVDQDQDGYLSSIDCADDDSSVYPGAPDAPDVPTFKDSNCDGIDGDVSHAVFVSTLGDDANPGTMEAPKRTLAAAPQGKDIYVTEGDFAETLNVVNGVSVYGGYNSSWQRSSSNITKITGSPASSDAAYASNITASTTLQLLTLAPTPPVAPGATSYGLRGVGSPGLVLDHLTAVAASGTAGSVGANGSLGARGGDGRPTNGQTGGSGGSSAAAHTGGAGGLGGYDGASGYGGAPGLSTTPDPWGGIGGPGGPGGAGGSNPHAGGTGYGGDSGHRGASGSGGGPGNTRAGSGAWSSEPGHYGQAGSAGHGGGGAGGGGSDGCTFGATYGGGGGGGGGGGAGGGAGAGGQGGGGSFGVFLESSSGALVRDSSVSASDGGAGGNGGSGGFPGAGGLGGAGGSGGRSGSLCGSDYAAGGRGGPGGPGGLGGAGGGSAGGPSVAIFGLDASQAPGTTVSHGQGGAGASGPGGAGVNGAAADYMP